jgi:ACR3 family arsenite efflux pump ArsB
MVLLTPCIDYVIVFTRLAGGSDRRLLAAAPLLMLAQWLCCRRTCGCSWALTVING